MFSEHVLGTTNPAEPFHRLHPEILFQHTHRQRFLAQTNDPAITDPMFDETRQLFSAEHIMLAAPGSESIAKAREPPTGCQ